MIYGHGGNIYAVAQELGLSFEDILDFSSNTNPMPFSCEFTEFLSENLSQIAHLPEVDSDEVKCAISSRYKLPHEHIIVGPGTTEYIYLIPKICKEQGIKKAIIPVPTYADYYDACKLESLEIYTVSWGAGDAQAGFLDMVCQIPGPKIIFLCNPNNPTGIFFEPQQILEAARNFPENFWIVDESYAPFLGQDEKTSLIAGSMSDNIVVLRSFSKIYGIPGLRIGYLFSGAEFFLQQIKHAARPWSVCRLSQLAASFLLKRPGYEEEARLLCMAEKDFLCRKIRENVPFLEPEPKAAHFVMFRVLEPWNAHDIAAEIRKSGILVRNCSNFIGLTGEYIRISPRSRRENERLLNVLEGIAAASM